jgi:predicted component of type VI protein secretion system
MLDAMQAFLHAELTGRGALAETQAPVAPLAAPPEPEPAAPPPETPEAMPEALPSPAARGPIPSRDAAYRQLEEVARYLEAVEPHSPVPALLRRAIRWGEMRLPDLLAELMQEEGGPFRLLRITPDASPGR